jgi:hypothetical protein
VASGAEGEAFHGVPVTIGIEVVEVHPAEWDRAPREAHNIRCFDHPLHRGLGCHNWNRGRPGTVRLARAHQDPQVAIHWPLVAVRLEDGMVAQAVTAARELLEPSQQRFPDELQSIIESACLSWDRGDADVARSRPHLSPRGRIRTSFLLGHFDKKWPRPIKTCTLRCARQMNNEILRTSGARAMAKKEKYLGSRDGEIGSAQQTQMGKHIYDTASHADNSHLYTYSVMRSPHVPVSAR